MTFVRFPLAVFVFVGGMCHPLLLLVYLFPSSLIPSPFSSSLYLLLSVSPSLLVGVRPLWYVSAHCHSHCTGAGVMVPYIDDSRASVLTVVSG